MQSTNLEHDDRKVIIIERDSGVGWAVAFIVLALAIGFGIIIFMDQQYMVEYKIEQALDRMQESRARHSLQSTRSYEHVPEAPAPEVLIQEKVSENEAVKPGATETEPAPAPALSNDADKSESSPKAADEYDASLENPRSLASRGGQAGLHKQH